jgi:hypothetical protein
MDSSQYVAAALAMAMFVNGMSLPGAVTSTASVHD